MNQREIKFRAWDDNLKIMITVFTLYNEGTGSVIPQTDQHSATTGTERYKITQFTGLKDKNGKEIYEGDVVKVVGETGECEIKFKDGGFYRIWIGTTIEVPIKELVEKFEIIGNIYQNPELVANKDSHIQ